MLSRGFLVAIVGVLALSSAASARASAFVWDIYNGAWGAAHSSESQQMVRAKDRCERRGGRYQYMYGDTYNNTKGYYVAFAIGWAGRNYAAAARRGRTQAEADRDAYNWLASQGVINIQIVRQFLDN